MKEIESRKRSEGKAAHEKDLMGTLLANIPDYIYFKDRHRRFVHVSNSFGNLFGCSPEEIIGKKDEDLFPEEIAKETAGDDRHVIESGIPLVNKAEGGESIGGGEHWVLTTKLPWRDREGNIIGLFGISREITERKKVEDTLRESEERYRLLVEKSHDVAYSVKPDGIITYISQQMTQYGYASEEVISRNFLELVVPEHRQEVLQKFDQGNRNGTSFATEFQLQGKDARRYWVETVGEIMVDDSGNPYLQVGVMRDISERKQMEEALQKAHDELDQRVMERTAQLSEIVDKLTDTELRYRTVADFTYDWEYWQNPDGTFKYVSPSCKRITGYEVGEFIDNPAFLDQIILPEDRNIWSNHRHEAIENRKPSEIQFRIRRKGGNICWIEHACQQVLDDRGEFLGFRGSNRDISIRKTGEIKLENAYSEIRALKAQLEADRTYLREEIKLEHDHENIIGNSDMLKYVLFRAEQVALTDTTVLILGETGTGKELIARAIHNASPRRGRPLIKVDCASLPANLIESELFGHEKGAFTGAVEKRVGRFELANGASLFLDEIGELPLGLQPKLLRVLQDGEFERLGSSQTIRTDVRVIAATNRNLEEDVRKKKFRMDLWYRLSVFTLSIPPLRERSEDIGLLVNYMIRNLGKKLLKRIRSVPSHILTKLQNYSWPGNVRELENVIERAIIITQGDTLQLEDSLDAHRPEDVESPDLPIKSLEEIEREHILLTLRNTNWKIHGKDGAAVLLDINPSTLRGRMRKHGIHRPPYKT